MPNNHFLHGDHHLSSRNYLNEIIDQQKKSGKEITRLDGKKILLNELKEATASQSLFGAEEFIVIENLFSRPKSKAQTETLEWLKDYKEEIPIILWESKSIGKVLQRKLPNGTTVKEFKTPVIVFKLVEQISPGKKNQSINVLSQALKVEAAEFLFVMICRQIRLLLLVKGGQPISGAPWMIGKFKKQAEDFTPKILLELYEKLYTIDKEIKTGQSQMPLEWRLKDWMMGL